MSKMEFAVQMQARTKQFAIHAIKFFGQLPKTEEARVIGRQLLRVEETDESLFWIELLEESGVCPSSQVATLKTGADELLSIFQTSLKTAKGKGL